MKERQERKYPFSDSDVLRIFNKLLKANLIELPEMKCPRKANKINDPNYCKYHHLISHLVEKFFVLKNKIMELKRKGEIAFDEEKASTNITSIIDSNPHVTSINLKISFRIFEPITIEIPSSSQRTIEHQSDP